MFSSSWLVGSVWPFVWGCKLEDRLTFVPTVEQNSWQTWEVNCGLEEVWGSWLVVSWKTLGLPSWEMATATLLAKMLLCGSFHGVRWISYELPGVDGHRNVKLPGRTIPKVWFPVPGTSQTADLIYPGQEPTTQAVGRMFDSSAGSSSEKELLWQCTWFCVSWSRFAGDNENQPSEAEGPPGLSCI